MDIIVIEKSIELIFERLFDSSSVVYAKNKEGFFLGANQSEVEMAGLSETKDLIGKTDLECCWHEKTEIYRSNDKMIEANNKSYYFIEPIQTAKNEIIQVLTVKAPLINQNDEVYGTVGIGTILNNNSCTKILSEFMLAAEILKLNLEPRILLSIITKALQFNKISEQYPHQRPLFEYGKIKFSLREAQCLHYLLNGYSAQKTSEKLGISPKTIEFHIAKIKEKTGCITKSQISNLAIDQEFIEIMFMKFD